MPGLRSTLLLAAAVPALWFAACSAPSETTTKDAADAGGDAGLTEEGGGDVSGVDAISSDVGHDSTDLRGDGADAGDLAEAAIADSAADQMPRDGALPCADCQSGGAPACTADFNPQIPCQTPIICCTTESMWFCMCAGFRCQWAKLCGP